LFADVLSSRGSYDPMFFVPLCARFSPPCVVIAPPLLSPFVPLTTDHVLCLFPMSVSDLFSKPFCPLSGACCLPSCCLCEGSSPSNATGAFSFINKSWIFLHPGPPPPLPLRTCWPLATVCDLLRLVPLSSPDFRLNDEAFFPLPLFAVEPFHRPPSTPFHRRSVLHSTSRRSGSRN